MWIECFADRARPGLNVVFFDPAVWALCAVSRYVCWIRRRQARAGRDKACASALSRTMPVRRFEGQRRAEGGCIHHEASGGWA